MPVSLSSQAVNIFFSYAVSARQDLEMFQRLLTHLSLLQRQHTIHAVYDSAIAPGQDVSQTIASYLDTADIIVLLLSADFFASERCYTVEFQRALALGQSGSARLIPVLLGPADWHLVPLAQLHPLPSNGTPIKLSRDREAAFADVARGIRHIVEEITRKARQAFSAPTPSADHTPLPTLPHRFNALFTDRSEILQTLSTTLTWDRATPDTLILALKGPGGIGKTQIVLEYIRHSISHYSTILWLNASSPERFSAELHMLADKLSLPQYDREDEARLLASLQRWLQGHSRWLLVIDHIADLTLVDLLVPRHSMGHVLLTTQVQAADTIATTLSITPLSLADGSTLLLRRAGLLNQTITSPDQIPSSLLEDVNTITTWLDGSPLALDQAGAYLAETGCSPSAYLALYKDERSQLLNRRGTLQASDSHPASLAVTLSLAFSRVSAEQPIYLEFLRLLAFVQPDAIPEEFLTSGASVLRGPLRSLLSQPLQLHAALASLRNFSLVYHHSERTLLGIHRLVQAVLIDALTTRQQRQWATLVVRMVNHVFPEISFATRATCERYLPQAQHCATLIREYRLHAKEAALLLERLGFFCYQHSSYTDARSYLLQALSIYEQNSRLDPLDLAQTLNSLGLLYHQLAAFTEAATFHQRARAIRERVLGQDHPNVAQSLHNLALLYTDEENYAAAETLYLEVLSLEMVAKGAASLDVAKTLQNLGLVYFHQEHYPQAQAMYSQALTIYQRHLPADHPDLIYPLDGLGAIAEANSDYTLATQLYQQAFAICEQAFGATHIQTAHSLNKLADMAFQVEDYTLASTLYHQALTTAEKVLGPDHPDIALFLNNLATLSVAQHDYATAEHLYLRSLHICEHALGTSHTWVTTIRENLASLADKINEHD